jgi:lipid-A-disaccharide synthase-like uncharacterized protein
MMLSPFDSKSAGSGSGEYPTNRVYVWVFFCAAIFGGLVLLLYVVGKANVISIAVSFFVALYCGDRLWDFFKRKP